MKVALIHMGYFIALMILSILSSFVIFGAGLGGSIDLFALFIPFVFSVLWVWIYISGVRRIRQLTSPTKNWTFISLFLSGIFTVYSLFLTTWILPVAFIISVILLLFWYLLLFAYTKSKSSFPQSMYGSILLIVSLIFAYLICEYLITM